jgi:hypothetical protein
MLFPRIRDLAIAVRRQYGDIDVIRIKVAMCSMVVVIENFGCRVVEP